MSSVNKCILIGNLGNDPEIRTFDNGGRIANMSIATSENWKDKTTGEPTEKWEAIRWYGTFKQTLNGLGNLMVRTSNAQTLGEALAHVEIVVAKLCQIMPDSFEGYVSKN